MDAGYKKLDVWNKGMDLLVEVYKITQSFPTEERYGITAQIRRNAVSIPSNIAEGYRRQTNKEFARFARISYGSGAELETQIEACKRLEFFKNETGVVDGLLSDVMRMLNRLISSLSDVKMIPTIDARRSTPEAI